MSERRPSLYDSCPKCSHTPLPTDQSLPAACPACGIILAKFIDRSGVEDADVAPTIDAALPEPNLHQRLFAAIVYVPERVESTGFWARCLLLVLFGLWGVRLIWLDHETGEMMSSFLHGPLLVFHEAGHVIFSPLGEFIMIFGGSLAQLLMPAVIVAALLFRNRDPFGAAIGAWFLGVSLLDLAPYVYDALHPQLLLLGGHTGEEGGHDWIYLLEETGLLQQAQTLGWLVHKSGAFLIFAAIGWAGWLLKQQKSRLSRI
jgi:hypothetical protein